MKQILLFLLIILIFVSVTKVTANQDNSYLDFHTGYIIKPGNDTVFGFIDINASKYDKCLFKITPRSETITFSPFEITEFRIEGGGYYVASKVKVDDEEKNLVTIAINSSNILHILSQFESVAYASVPV
jgi:hypothetical protein